MDERKEGRRGMKRIRNAKRNRHEQKDCSNVQNKQPRPKNNREKEILSAFVDVGGSVGIVSEKSWQAEG
jgi:hypothetical protein